MQLFVQFKGPYTPSSLGKKCHEIMNFSDAIFSCNVYTHQKHCDFVGGRGQWKKWGKKINAVNSSCKISLSVWTAALRKGEAKNIFNAQNVLTTFLCLVSKGLHSHVWFCETLPLAVRKVCEFYCHCGDLFPVYLGIFQLSIWCKRAWWGG